MREILKKAKPGYGQVDTDESVSIQNRADARRYLPGHGPHMYFKVDPEVSAKRKSGRTRRKRKESIWRAKGLTIIDGSKNMFKIQK